MGNKVVDFIGPRRKWKKVVLKQNAFDGGELIKELNGLFERYRISRADQNDTFIWKATSTRDLSFKSSYKLMFDKALEPNYWGNIWFNHLIPKINIFWWTNIYGKYSLLIIS